MNLKINSIRAYIIFLLIFIACPLASQAMINKAAVENYINVSADASNNTEKTNITTGDSSANVHIENIINGQQVKPLIVELEAINGESKELIINNSNIINNEIEAEKTAETPEQLIIDQKNQETSSNIFQKIANWFDSIFSKITETIKNLL